MVQEIQDTATEKIVSIFEKQKVYAPKYKLSKAKARLEKINRIHKYLTNPKNEKLLLDALSQDLRKPTVEAKTSEITIILHSIKDIRHKLNSWMRDKTVVTPLLFAGHSSYIRYEAKGVALIISPWNYPFQLCINPLLYALAAGCTAILKPSEFSVATSTFIAKMISDIFDEKEVAVCQGGIPTSQTLLGLPFDHMYFTGSPMVGKIVMAAAAKQLSSVTLELGGKSPCFIAEDANIDKTARKLVWGKFFNTGQTCIAPDYVLVPEKHLNTLTESLKKYITSFYDPNGNGIQASPDLGRLISDKHFDKVSSLIADAVEHGATVVTGGGTDSLERFISPTVLTNVDPKSLVLQEEIFGPVLPIVTYRSLDEALAFVAEKPKPLALYIMSGKKKTIRKIINNTSAGGTVVNDFLVHFANHNLPFGGVNNSGIGKSHGKHGFLAFSNERGVMRNRMSPTSLLYPPFTNFKQKLADIAGRWL